MSARERKEKRKKEKKKKRKKEKKERGKGKGKALARMIGRRNFRANLNSSPQASIFLGLFDFPGVGVNFYLASAALPRVAR